MNYLVATGAMCLSRATIFFKSATWIKRMAAMTHSVMPIPHNKKSKYSYLYRLADLAGKDGLETYLSATIDSFDGYEQYLLSGEEILQPIRRDFDNINKLPLTGLQKIMNLDFDNILAGDLLVKMDIATMAHSLEGRSPLLCKGLLEYIPGLPDQLKIRNNQTKYLLRQLAEKYLPATLIHQPKRGFEIPLKKWIDQQLSEIITSYILSPNSFSRNFVTKDFAEKLWQRKIPVGDEKRAKMIWTLFVLDVWHKKCYLQHG